MFYSRRLSIEERKNKKKAIILFLGSLVFVLLFIFYGLPFIVKLLTFVAELRLSSESLESPDETPPPPPIIEEIPKYTNETELEIQGSAEPGSNVKLFINQDQIEILTDSQGRFIHKIPLNEGENEIYAIAIDNSANESQSSKKFTVIVDKKPPQLEIIKPKDRQQFFGSSERQIIIEGQTENDASVDINTRWVVVNKEGKFIYTASLNPGENSFNIQSKDPAGNSTEKNLILYYTP